MSNVLACAQSFGEPLPILDKDAQGITPASRRSVQQWLKDLPLNRLCREQPESARNFQYALLSAHEAYHRRVVRPAHDATPGLSVDREMRSYLHYGLNVLDGQLDPHPQDEAVRDRAAQLEMQYLNQLDTRGRQGFALAQRAADRAMDREATKCYGDPQFHREHPEFWRHLAIIRRIRNMANDVMEDNRSLEFPRVLPKGRDWIPIATRHPTYRFTEEQRACARQLRLLLEGAPVDSAHAVALMDGMVGKELKKPTIVDEMKMTAIDTCNDFVAQLERLRNTVNEDHLRILGQQSGEMPVWPAFDQDVDAPEKLTGCMEELCSMMRKSKWEAIVAELKTQGASPMLIERAEQTLDYWSLGVLWWEKNRQAVADARNHAIRSGEPIDANLVDVTRDPGYPRIPNGKIGCSERACDERDELVSLLAAENKPQLRALSTLVEGRGLGANGEFRISGTGARGFWERAPDGSLQPKRGAMRLLQERRWELGRLEGGDVSRIIIAEYAKDTWQALHTELYKMGLGLQLGPNHRPDGISITALVEDAPNLPDYIAETDRMLQSTHQASTTDKADIPMKLSSKIAGSDFPKRNGQLSKMLAQMQMQANNDRLQKLYPRAEISMRLGSGETTERGGGPRGYRDEQAGMVHMASSGEDGKPRSIVAQTVQGVGVDRSFMTPMAAQASRLRYERLSLQAHDDIEQFDPMRQLAAELALHVGGRSRLCDDPAYETLLVNNEIVAALSQREVGGSRGKDPAEDFQGPLKMRTIRVVRTYRDTGMLSWYNNLLDVPKPLLDRLAADARMGGRLGRWYVASLFHEATQADPELLRFVVGHKGGLEGEENREKLRMVDTLQKAHSHLCDWLREEGFALREPHDMLIAAPGPLLTQQVEGLGLRPDSDYETIEQAMRQQRLERRSVAEMAAIKIPPNAPGHSKLVAEHADLVTKLQLTHRLYNSTDGEG
ncbi:MAG: hypothetical protein Q7U62_06070 [Burkholderiaceae bacterium]|nr:hypothetical protein [Burkholderiaceae bacterium]